MIKKWMNWKRLIIFILAVILVCGFMPTDMTFVQAGDSVSGREWAYDKDNLDYTFQTINGTSVTSAAQGKPKVLIFFNTSFDCKYALRTITRANNYGNVDIIAIESSGQTKQDTINFIDSYTYDNDYMTYCYSTDNYESISKEYSYHCRLYSSTIYTGCTLIVYIDANNKIQYMTYLAADAQEVADNLNKYCNTNINLETKKTFTSVTNTVNGIYLKWDAIDNVDFYSVEYKKEGETYWWRTSTRNNYYRHTSMLESGKKYSFRIKAYEENSEGKGEIIDCSEEITYTYVATPDLTLRVNRAAGIGLGWNKIEGATGYAIYRKTYYENDPWVRVATIKDGNTTTWDDTSVKAENGSVYKYTIRALAGSNRNIMSGCRSTGRTMVRLTSRTLKTATKTSANSIKCTWGTTVQATGYEVRFMVGNSVYKTYTIGNFNTGVKTFTGLKAGQTYKIQVRAYRKIPNVGSFYSAWSTPKYVNL